MAAAGQPRRPRGQPSDISRVLETRPNGETVTVADRIIQLVRTGNYMEHAAAAVGISARTAYEWQRIGARVTEARARAAAADEPAPKLTAHERRCHDFSQAVDRADGEWVAETAARLEQVARGGRQSTVVTEYTELDDTGRERVVQRIRRTETAPPDPKIDLWRLERRHPKLYGRKQQLEHSGPDGAPIPVQVQADQVVTCITGILADLAIELDDHVRAVCAARLRAMSAAARTDAVDATSRETRELTS